MTGEQFGKVLVLAGLALVAVGVLFWLFGPRWDARGGLLPGDLSLRRGSTSFYFPIVTCLVLSALLTLVLRLFNR